MQISDAYKKTVCFLTENGVENASFEADCLFEQFYSVDRIKRVNHPSEEIDFSLVEDALNERAGGKPLQYILGKWDFYGFTYSVGEGVLIPRPETELLVENVLEILKDKKNPVIYDLCAGTGCIGLTLARLIPDSTVYLFEKSKEAFSFLKKNSEGIENAISVNADIITIDCKKYKKPDMIVSNPPYVRTDEIKSLQKEVLNEPDMALDGGEDGLEFYRLIGQKWLPLLNGNGAVAVECGETQAEYISSLFKNYCTDTFTLKDYSGTERIVIGEK